MQKTDFKRYDIRFFTPEEVIATGADLKDIQLGLMDRLDTFRLMLGQPVHLLHNGMTTGEHVSPWHPKGLAADIYSNPHVTPKQIFKAALASEFKGVGIYWNGAAYSAHLDLGDSYRFWTWVKKDRAEKWVKYDLMLDDGIIKKVAKSI